jgi:hypothetical protein
MRFDVRRFSAQQSLSHPIVNQAFNSLRRVISFTAADQTVIRVNPDQNQIRHDRSWNNCFNCGDTRHGFSSRERQRSRESLAAEIVTNKREQLGDGWEKLIEEFLITLVVGHSKIIVPLPEHLHA